MIPEKLPSLPANLYFIRNGSLWRWPEEGQNLQQVVIGPQQSRSTGGKLARPVSGAPPAGVRAYRLSPDERFLIYTFGVVSPETFEPEMIVLDQVTGESYPISTARNFETTSLNKPSFDIIPDGRYAIYTAWNVKPTTSSSQGAGIVEVSNAPGGVKYGTIFAVDVTNINREFELGYCTSQSDANWTLECDRDFALSPDGSQIAFSDGRGVWLSDVPEGNPRLIAEHQHHNNFCGIWHVRDWAPDGKHLLIDVGCYEGGYSGIMDVTTGEVQKIPHTRNYPGPYVNITWRRNGTDLLVSSINLVTGVGPVCLAQIPTAAPTQESVIISTTWPSEVWPTEPHDLPDGRIGFAHQPCVDGPGMQPGIYTIARDGTGLEFVSPLPASPCYISEIMHKKPFGTVLWSPEGNAYLYFRPDEQPASQTNLLLGWADGSDLWDVRELLADAHTFQWRPPYAGYWRQRE